VLALCLGNEIPADVLRWYGTEAIGDVLAGLVDTAHSEDPNRLVTYAGYPTAEYFQVRDLDFVTFNVFLEQRDEYRRYLTRLQHLAADLPLVLGEIGLDSAGTKRGAARQRETLDWQLQIATERGVAGTCVFAWTDDWWVGDHEVEGWHFGLTDADRRPRPALATAARWNGRTVRDLDVDWPSISVVICAYNAASTIGECLHHTCALDYPKLEIIVVDDGSRDETAAIAATYPRARVLEIPHGGLSVARNAGLAAASGELIAYLDSDAYPAPEWPYYLALGLHGPNVAGVGGPNVSPQEDPIAAQVVAAAPGGPVHVLLSDTDAEHIPGCNMAFRRDVLVEVGGFDPIFDAAGDDVDLCWRVLDRGWTIGFHPAALVWHHRRPGLRPYLRQQRGYGRSETLVEARHPARFSILGSARWKGRIYQSRAVNGSRQRIYRGPFGQAAYQSVYGGGGYALDLVHQVGVPAATCALATAPLAIVTPWLALPAIAALTFGVALLTVDARRAARSAPVRRQRRIFGWRVAVHQLSQPVVRTWARSRARSRAVPRALAPDPAPQRVGSGPGGVSLFVEDRPRIDLVAALTNALRRLGVRARPISGWEDHDGTFLVSTLLSADLVTSSHPVGYVQARMRPRVRGLRLLTALTVAAAIALIEPVLGAAFVAVLAAAMAHGFVRARTLLAAVSRSTPR
jgi:glycosyltransferase involved in cell wall biosynthesis